MTEAAQESQTPTQNQSEESQQKPNSFTQEDVNKIAGNRAKEAEQRAINNLLKRAGAESVDEVLEGYKGFKTVEEESKTEAEKLQSQLQEYQQKEAVWERARTRNAFKEQIGLPNPRLALGAALEAGIELQLDDKGNVENLQDIRNQLRTDNPREFGDGSADGGAKGPLPGNTPQEQMGSFLGQVLNR